MSEPLWLDDPKICFEIAKHDPAIFNSLIRLSKSINRGLSTYTAAMQERYPHHGLVFPICKYIHSALGCIDYEQTKWYCLDKKVLPRIPPNPKYAGLKTVEDLEKLSADWDLTCPWTMELLFEGTGYFVPDLPSLVGQTLFMTNFFNDRRGTWHWGLLDNGHVVINTSAAEPPRLVARSLAELFSELDLLHRITKLSSNMNNLMGLHDLEAEAYLEALISRWPRNPEGVYDFCALCGGGKFTCNRGTRLSCKVCPNYNVCGECYVEGEHKHTLHDCSSRDFQDVCTSCRASLWNSLGWAFVCKNWGWADNESPCTNNIFCKACMDQGKGGHCCGAEFIDFHVLRSYCDVCQRPITRWEERLKCRQCKDNNPRFDICVECYEKSGKKPPHEERHEMILKYRSIYPCNVSWGACARTSMTRYFSHCRVCDINACFQCKAGLDVCIAQGHIVNEY